MTAAEALLLPGARLTDAERAAAALLEIDIENHLGTHMEYNGCNGDRAFRTNEQNSNVIAAVNRSLVRQGWITKWDPTYGQPQKGQRALTGWQLQLTPNAPAYAEAEAKGKN